ncbi:hypothetical protein V2J09_010554 [Rumex salicifolius]
MAPLESCSPSILVAMERLWFHKIVLCSEPNICPKKTPPPVQMMNTPSFSSSSTSSSSSDQSVQISLNSSSEPTDYSDDDDIIEDFSFAVHGSLPTILSPHQQMDSEDEDDEKERLENEDSIKELTPSRTNQVIKRAKSSTTQNRRHIKSTRLRLERTVSCKTLEELEQEEVKGFMDLGFIFNKDRLTPRMMSVLPGLQRLQGEEKDELFDAKQGHEEEDMMKVVCSNKAELAKKKPYLSEAWMIKRPDSPLVRLRMSRPSTTSNDMKIHLKIWAKTVASSAIKGS